MKKMKPIAIVGMGGVFPGASDLSTFWKNILDKVDTSAVVPAHRWAAPPHTMVSKGYQPDKAYSRRACLVRDFNFDPAGLNLSQDLLEDLDPLFHLTLHAGREASVECSLENVNRSRIGVILAAIALPTDGASTLARNTVGRSFEQQAVHRMAQHLSQSEIPAPKHRCLDAKVTSLPAALLADALGFKGGTLTLDAACASSLYAIKLACDELNAHRADAMLAGGVSRPDCLYTQVGFSQLRALSPSGRCAPFDESADGLVVGEGAGIMVLKRLSDAVSAGDTIYGVIRGIGLSNDLCGNLLAPDSEGQVRAMKKAYKASGWSVRDVDFIECHGAGTPLGDATELVSLNRLWDENGGNAGRCAIGSIKSMIGHLLTAAAAAGLIKILLGFKHGLLPPSIHFHRPPAHSPLPDGPFRIQTEVMPWERKNESTPRRAAINAFGFGGINAHLLVEEYIDIKPAGQPVSQSTSYIGNHPTVKTGRPADRPAGDPIAIVGMDAAFGSLDSLDSFEAALFEGTSALGTRPAHRWKGADRIVEGWLDGRSLPGAYLDKFAISPADFRIPPADVPDILPQHLLMLKTALGATRDADISPAATKPDMGAIIGIDFDFEATNFHLRWMLHNQIRQWNQTYRLGLNETECDHWRQELARALGPPLTHQRTLGALGSMVASRLAREFRLGGPSFVVSDGPAAGFRALELGIRSLQQHETDAMLVGAVDLGGDARNIAMTAGMMNYSRNGAVRPFHPLADGTLPGEGAGAMVIKRLADALDQGNRIYAVIHAMGTSKGKMKDALSMATAYTTAMNTALAEARWHPSEIGYLEIHGSGDRDEDEIEKRALMHLFPPSQVSSEPSTVCALGANKPIIGHAGAAAAMASLIKATLSVFRQQLSPWPSPMDIDPEIRTHRFLELPPEMRPWQSSTRERRHRAGVTAITAEGGCACILLEGHPESKENFPATRPDDMTGERSDTADMITITVGGLPRRPPLPPVKPSTEPESRIAVDSVPDEDVTATSPEIDMIRRVSENSAATESAHHRFLELSADLTRSYGEALALQNDIVNRHPEALEKPATREAVRHMPDTSRQPAAGQSGPRAIPVEESRDRRSIRPMGHGPDQPVFSRDRCMEFATGSVAQVFGPSFAEVDTYPARVRLPDEPLMLVDRILTITGEKGGLGSGRIVTEHDVHDDAWYLDGGRAPACIAVEAGQADLFLSAYLGIDFRVKGKRTYRLLDATVEFHRSLPCPGEVIRYDIRIEKFVRQGDTYLFFFRFDGFIDGQPLITMTDGCAGFFTPQEVEDSGGIIQAEQPDKPASGEGRGRWNHLVPIRAETYSDEKLEHLRKGDPAGCFGKFFQGIVIPANLTLPGGRMRLIHRIQRFDPEGGHYRMGLIRAEADIHPGDWFLTCHFVDDMVMPGTLMYECCAHTLRVFLQRMGWFCDRPDARYEPVGGVRSRLKCRGPVLPTTRHVVYEVEITEVGYHPEPFVIGDAHIFADGRRIVWFENVSMKMTGVTWPDLEAFWAIHKDRKEMPLPAQQARPVVFNRDRLLTFTRGKPSYAFGDRYEPFDDDRFIARLPAPPYLFIDHIIRCDPEPWVVKPDGWVEAEFTTAPDHWYFEADRSGIMPFAVFLEIALQPCGWLAAYMGSALLSEHDLRFRNLGGSGAINHDLPVGHHRLTTRVRLTQVSKAADMIIETFDFEIRRNEEVIYTGDTYFGFFTSKALARQEGIRDAEERRFKPAPNQSVLSEPHRFADVAPLLPAKTGNGRHPHFYGLQMPASAIRMIDRIDLFVPDGGPHGLGYIRASKRVNADDWFFAAHFFQDPVCPGSLGLESFIQLLKYYALTIWKDKVKKYSFSLVRPLNHQWVYRGQILRSNEMVTVEAVVTRVEDDPVLSITADGYLSVDGRCIYEMKQFGIMLERF